MAGLLQKLNKKPRRAARDNAATRIVLSERAVSDGSQGSRPPSGGFKAPGADLLLDPATMGAREHGSGITQELARQTNDSLPWWISSPPKTSSRVDTIVPLARGLMNREIETEVHDEEELRKILRKFVQTAAGALPSDESLSQKESESAVAELWNLLKGKGPLEPLYDDPLVTDILITGHDSIKCIRRGHLLETPFHFRTSEEYDEFLSAILKSAGWEFSIKQPLINVVLADKWRSRLHAIHASLLDSEDHSLSIRIPRLPQVSFYELIRTKTAPATVAAWLTELVATPGCSILVTGPAGCGKTTFTSALLGAVPSEDRIITIEEVPELFPTSHHVEKFLLANSLRSRDIGRTLVEAALKRGPRWIAFGELRPGQSPAVLRALEGGTSVVLTLGAASAGAALRSIVDDLRQQIPTAPGDELTKRIHEGIDIIVTMGTEEGRPFISSIIECSMSDDPSGFTEIVRFLGEDNGKRKWQLSAPQSYWVRVLAERGHQLRPGGGLLSGPE